MITSEQHHEFSEIFEKHRVEEDWSKEFDAITSNASVSDHMGKETESSLNNTTGTTTRSEDWAAEFEANQSNLNSISDEMDSKFLENFQEAWKAIDGDSAIYDQTHPWANEFESNKSHLNPFTGDLAPYQFEPNNPYLNHENPFNIGIQIVESGGSLSRAALAFEAAVQKDPHHSEAWSRLGVVQAENEKENAAIAALQRAVREDDTNLKALMVNIFF